MFRSKSDFNLSVKRNASILLSLFVLISQASAGVPNHSEVVSDPQKQAVVVDQRPDKIRSLELLEKIMARFLSERTFLDASETVQIPGLSQSSDQQKFQRISSESTREAQTQNLPDIEEGAAYKSQTDAKEASLSFIPFAAPKAVVVLDHGVANIFINNYEPLELSEQPVSLIDIGKYPNLAEAFGNDQNLFTLTPTIAGNVSFTVDAPNDTYFADQWGLNLFNVLDAWEFGRGDGIVVAVIDDSFDYNHPDLASNIWINEDEIPGNGIDDDNNGYIDDYRGWDMRNNDNYAYSSNVNAGHGTHVAGIIGAVDENNRGISGVAPNSQIMAIQGFNYNDYNNDPTVAAAITNSIYYAVDNGARVINMSLGMSPTAYSAQTLQEFEDAITYAKNHNVIVVAAAGNNSGLISAYPALFEDVLTIGALSYYGGNFYSAASYSSTGPRLDFMAPGTGILSLRSASGWGSAYSGDADYTIASGTSMAAPHVAGAVALLLEQDPTMTLDDIYRRLSFSAYDVGDAGRDDLYGWGILDLTKALSEDYYNDGSLKHLYIPLSDPSLVIQADFRQNGSIERIYLEDGRIFEYYDDNYYGQGDGRISKMIQAEGNYTAYLKYYSGTENAFIQQDYSAQDQLLETRYYDRTGSLIGKNLQVLYYASGNLHSITDPQTGIATYYMDEDFYLNGTGRTDRISFSQDAELRFTYQAPDSDVPASKALYVADQLYRTDTFSTSGIMTLRAYADGDEISYYTSTNVHTATVSSTITQNTTLVYTYKDEDYYGDGVGRLDRITLADGSYYLFTEYWNSSDIRKQVQLFDSSDALLETFNYDDQGNPEGVQGGVTLKTHGKDVSHVIVANNYAAWIAAWGFNPDKSYIYLRDLIDGTHKSVDTQYLNQSAYTPVGLSGNGDVLSREISTSGKVLLKLYTAAGASVLAYGGSDVTEASVNSQGVAVWTQENRIYRYSSGVNSVVASENEGVFKVRLSDDNFIAWYGKNSGEEALKIYNPQSRQTVTVLQDAALNIQDVSLGSGGNLYFSTHSDSGDLLFYYDGSQVHDITPPVEGQFELMVSTADGSAIWKSQTSTGQAAFVQELYLTRQGATVKLTGLFDSFTGPVMNESGNVAWIEDDGGSRSVYRSVGGQQVRIADLSSETNDLFIINDNTVIWTDQGKLFAYSGSSVRELEIGVFSKVFGVNDDLTVFFEDADSNLVEAEISFTSEYDLPPSVCADGNVCTTYANDRIKRITSSDSSYTEYRNEFFYGNNTGRKVLESDGSDTEIRYTEYYGDTNPGAEDDTDIVKTKDTYESGTHVQRDEYNEDRSLKSTTMYYTDTGRIMSVFEAQTGVTQEYINEDFAGTGQGRLHRKIFADGSSERIDRYWGDETPDDTADDTAVPRMISFFDTEGNLIETKEYDRDGNEVANRYGIGAVYSFDESHDFSTQMQGAPGYEEMMAQKEYELENFYSPESSDDVFELESSSRSTFLGRITSPI